MKNLKTNAISAALVALLFLSSCEDQCELVYSYTYYEPVYITMDELRSSISFEAPRDIKSAGKIYYIDNHILINEPNEGIHFINNQNPSTPVPVGFLAIPGNFDLAAVSGTLYVDSYIDLVVIDITDINQPKEIERLENVFQNYNSYGFYLDQQFGLVREWKEVTTLENVPSDCSGNTDWGRYYGGGIAVYADTQFSGAEAMSPTNPGMGGSMARFTIANQHLYMVDSYDLRVVDISTANAPVQGNTTNLGWGVETIFPFGSKLFIGANNGMWIYDISDPATPVQLSKYEHINSCDPVVTDGQYAYVTLRSGNECSGFTNQLEVVDISDPTQPEQVAVYPMTNPHGLAVDQNRLYICDGEDGLKVFDKSNVLEIDQHLLKHFDDIHAFDVIAFNCNIMLIGEDGLHQYKCAEPLQLQYLSTIKLKNP